jgi:hypothetical protein
MPGGLDHLYRFHAHNGFSEHADGPMWSVSGGSLEGTTRFYRVQYDGRSFEAVLKPEGGGGAATEWDEAAERFLLEVQDWLKSHEGLDDTFLSAVYMLFREDPWLQTQNHVIVRIEPVD